MKRHLSIKHRFTAKLTAHPDRVAILARQNKREILLNVPHSKALAVVMAGQDIAWVKMHIIPEGDGSFVLDFIAPTRPRGW